MTTDDQIEDVKLQYDTNREATKISASSSVEIDQYEYFTGEEINLNKNNKIHLKIIYLFSFGKSF